MARRSAAADVVEIARLEKVDVAIETERPPQGQLGVVLVEPVDLMQRRLDRDFVVPIDRGRTAEALIALEDQDAQAGAGTESPAVKPPSPEPITIASYVRAIACSFAGLAVGEREANALTEVMNADAIGTDQARASHLAMPANRGDCRDAAECVIFPPKQIQGSARGSAHD